jgi:hypothetical protein
MWSATSKGDCETGYASNKYRIAITVSDSIKVNGSRVIILILRCDRSTLHVSQLPISLVAVRAFSIAPRQ